MISEELDQLAISTMNNALEVLAQDKELWPIAVLASEDDFEFQQFSEDAPEECWEAAREYIRQSAASISAYAICYDGHAEVEYVSESGEIVVSNSDALIIDFGEKGSEESYSMITPYRSAVAPGGFEIIAESSLLEEDENLLG